MANKSPSGKLQAKPGVVTEYVVSTATRGHVTLEGIADHRCELVDVSTRDECRFLLACDARVEPDAAWVTARVEQVETSPAWRDETITRLFESGHWHTTEAERAAYAGFRRILSTIESQLASARASTVSSSSAASQVRELEESLADEVQRAHARLTAGLSRRAECSVQWLHDQYGTVRGLRYGAPVIRADCCPYCTGSLIARPYTVGLWPVATRALIECERCLAIADAPPDYPLVTIQHGTPVVIGREAELVIEGYNHNAEPALVAASLAVDSRSGTFKGCEARPEVHQRVVAGCLPFRFCFRLQVPASFSPHSHFIHGVVVFNGAILTAMRRTDILLASARSVSANVSQMPFPDP